jgi:hypothetical protein
MALSFLKGRKLAVPPKTSGTQKGDPMVLAKNKIIGGVQIQKQFVELTLKGEPIPKGDGGRSLSTWFYKEIDGTIWTTLRYGQISMPLDGEKTSVSVGRLEDVPAFYDSVIKAIEKGELDSIIADLQKRRSDSLKGGTRAPRKARAGAD